MNDETRNIRRARACTPPASLITAEQRARFEATLNRDDEVVDAVRASRLASDLVAQFDYEQTFAIVGGSADRKWHDIDLTLARHVLRLEQRLAELCE